MRLPLRLFSRQLRRPSRQDASRQLQRLPHCCRSPKSRLANQRGAGDHQAQHRCRQPAQGIVRHGLAPPGASDWFRRDFWRRRGLGRNRWFSAGRGQMRQPPRSI